MREKDIIIICGIICATLIISGILFWPTLYRYDKINFGDKRSGQYLARVNRLTGYTEVLDSSGWYLKGGEKKANVMPQEEKNKVKIMGYFHDNAAEGQDPYARVVKLESNYKGDIYNGTSWTIKKIRLSIVAKDKGGKIEWQKTYEASVDIAPFSKGYCSIKLMDNTVKIEFEPYIPPKAKADSLEAPRGNKEASREGAPKGRWGPPIGEALLPDVKIEEAFGYKD